MAASWEPDLLEQVARATTLEVAATGVHWTFSPVLCIAHDLRWGRMARRRPWMIIGVAGLAVALFIVSIGTNTVTLAIGWFIAQSFANLGFAAFMASLSDQLSDKQYGTVSGIVGIAQNVGIMGVAYGVYVAVDLALVFSVLPDRKNAGKDLGVFNMANALPQSLAPAVGAWALASLGAGTNFMPLLMMAAAASALGGVITMFIRGVR